MCLLHQSGRGHFFKLSTVLSAFLSLDHLWSWSLGNKQNRSVTITLTPFLTDIPHTPRGQRQHNLFPRVLGLLSQSKANVVCNTDSGIGTSLMTGTLQLIALVVTSIGR